jgi:hypothetical protein
MAPAPNQLLIPWVKVPSLAGETEFHFVVIIHFHLLLRQSMLKQ